MISNPTPPRASAAASRLRPVSARVAATLLVVVVGACSDALEPVAYDARVDLTRAWERVEPAATGVDADALGAAVASAAAIPRLSSLLVVHRGRLIHEGYYHGNDQARLADLRSGTKTVVATLTGIAIDQGHLRLDSTLEELIPAGEAVLSPWERAITVADLLTMSGGWTWHESGAVGYNEWIESDDPVAYLLARPKAAEPGTTFEYNSAAAHLLGVALEHAVGTSLPVYADQVLFEPLAIRSREWEPLGAHVNGGSGLDLLPIDLARLGQLYLQDGWSGERRVLPAGWVDAATTRHFDWTFQTGGTSVSYGYLIWTDEVNHAYMAWGYGGQFIYVAPERDLVVVATTVWWQIDGQSAPSNLASQVLAAIAGGIVPAVPRH